jgi:hypothetical protein
MDMPFKGYFIRMWQNYFNNAELPITFYYTNEEGHADLAKPGTVPGCVMGALVKVQRGQSLAFNGDSVGCGGGKTYLGFSNDLGADAELFLSYGIPGKMEGERLKKSPEIVREYMDKNDPAVKAPGKYIVFKRWDMLEATDDPDVVIFYAVPDVLSGLFMLASFDESEQNTVITPWGSGCLSIVYHPFREIKNAHPRAIIGAFDSSVRSFFPKDVLTFSVPMSKFTHMVDNMEESFLITKSWKTVQKRII